MEAPAAAAAAAGGDARKAHVVLGHGVCHGGWCWFKVAARLRAAGHRVTAPDLAASGVDPRPLREVPTFRDYSEPLLDLMDALPPGEKVVLVGHSFGGVSVALAAELFPEKVAVAVFLSAFMPDHSSPPSHVLEKLMEQPLDWMDAEMKPQDPEGKLPISMTLGPRIARTNFYHLCSPEDLTLGRSLMRVGSLFVEDLKLQRRYSEDRYGSVRKVFVVCGEDRAITVGFQRWMIGNNPVDEVMVIDGADHMAMLSTPDQLLECLIHIAHKY